MPNSNLPNEQKTNWTSSEYVMPDDINEWGGAINQLSESMPIYASTGNFYKVSSSSTANVIKLEPITFIAQDITQNETVISYLDGMSVWFLATSTNSSNVTVNLNNLGAKPIYNINNTQLSSGKIKSGYFIHLVYNKLNDRFYLTNVEGLPEFTNHSGKFLTNNGSEAYWQSFVSKTVELAGAVTGSAVMNTGTSDVLTIQTEGKNKKLTLTGAVTGEVTFNTGNTNNITLETSLSSPVINTLQRMYPIGAIYIGVMTGDCPMQALFGTWTLISSGLTLQQAGNGYDVGNQIPAGLPGIEGTFSFSGTDGAAGNITGAFTQTTSTKGAGKYHHSDQSKVKQNVVFEAYDSNSIYGQSNTVQPPALAVNIWRRTA